MAEPAERRRRGRPALDETDGSTSVHLRLSCRTYDDLYARARRERVSVQEFIRIVIDQEKKNVK